MAASFISMRAQCRLLALFGQTDCVWVCDLLEQQPTKGACYRDGPYRLGGACTFQFGRNVRATLAAPLTRKGNGGFQDCVEAEVCNGGKIK